MYIANFFHRMCLFMKGVQHNVKINKSINFLFHLVFPLFISQTKSSSAKLHREIEADTWNLAHFYNFLVISFSCKIYFRR